MRGRQESGENRGNWSCFPSPFFVLELVFLFFSFLDAGSGSQSALARLNGGCRNMQACACICVCLWICERQREELVGIVVVCGLERERERKREKEDIL